MLSSPNNLKELITKQINEEYKNSLFPNEILQERDLNFTSFYLKLGPEFIPNLIKSLDPTNPDFVLLEY